MEGLRQENEVKVPTQNETDGGSRGPPPGGKEGAEDMRVPRIGNGIKKHVKTRYC